MAQIPENLQGFDKKLLKEHLGKKLIQFVKVFDPEWKEDDPSILEAVLQIRANTHLLELLGGDSKFWRVIYNYDKLDHLDGPSWIFDEVRVSSNKLDQLIADQKAVAI